MVAKTIVKEEKARHPDFYIASNNCVVAAYPVAADILQRESAQIVGVPFLFYVGTRSTVAQVNESAQYMARVAIPGGSAPHYFSNTDLDRMLAGTVTRKDLDQFTTWPGQVEIVPNKTISLEKLASWWVPYSFGVGHEGDVKHHTPFRTPADYQRMVQSILPDVQPERAYMKEQAEKQVQDAALFGNRLKALVGMYHPKTEAYTPRVAVHSSWK